MITPFVFDRPIQEYFDQMVRGLAAQGWAKSEGERRSGYQQPSGDYMDCVYRGPEGRKCAVGQVIPDDVAAVWDGVSTSAFDWLVGRGYAEAAPEIIRFFVAGQAAHDQAEGPIEMRERFERLCSEYQLDWPEDVK